jgi:hypothetical protein
LGVSKGDRPAKAWVIVQKTPPPLDDAKKVFRQAVGLKQLLPNGAVEGLGLFSQPTEPLLADIPERRKTAKQTFEGCGWVVGHASES